MNRLNQLKDDYTKDLVQQLSKKILSGANLDDSFNFIFNEFSGLIPFDRIGFAEVDEDCNYVRARWGRSLGTMFLREGFTAPLAGTSLSIVLNLRIPRVLNDLPGYLAKRPNSRSTRLIVREGFMSSMTCPLYTKNKPLGFLFFSSRQPNAYHEKHVSTLKELAMQTALLIMTSNVELTGQETLNKIQDPVADQSNIDGPIKQWVYGLHPGMILAENLSLSNGALLLSNGSLLSAEAVRRIAYLHAKGFLSVDKIEVTQSTEIPV